MEDRKIENEIICDKSCKIVLTCPCFFGIMKEIMQYGVIWMANDVRLPPDIIQAIEEVASSGATVKVKFTKGSWKVQEEKIRLVIARGI